MFAPPPLTGECCHCQECLLAGISHRPVVRAPNGELHGKALADWWKAKDTFDASLKAVIGRKGIA